MTELCVFCQIVWGYARATVLRNWGPVVAIEPHNPVVPGHALVIPIKHVQDAVQDPAVSAETMRAASELAADLAPCNIITSVGAEATQTVYHLHLHVVPRRAGDGLALPWTGQEDRGVTHSYANVAPMILRHLVNGREGFVILPEGEDDDGIYFEDWDTVKEWVTTLAGQVVLAADPAELQWYDDWIGD